jgi:hypothetical protein
LSSSVFPGLLACTAGQASTLLQRAARRSCRSGCRRCIPRGSCRRRMGSDGRRSAGADALRRTPGAGRRPSCPAAWAVPQHPCLIQWTGDVPVWCRSWRFLPTQSGVRRPAGRAAEHSIDAWGVQRFPPKRPTGVGIWRGLPPRIGSPEVMPPMGKATGFRCGGSVDWTVGLGALGTARALDISG